jgi:hypothetical protein
MSAAATTAGAAIRAIYFEHNIFLKAGNVVPGFCVLYYKMFDKMKTVLQPFYRVYRPIRRLKEKGVANAGV